MFKKLLPLVLIIISTAGCASSNYYYGSDSARLPAVRNYHPGANIYALTYNLIKYNHYGLTQEEKMKQQQAVFHALNNTQNGDLVEWYNVENNSKGQVKVIQTYPQGSGYCRTVYSMITKNNSSRNFNETACKEAGHEGWRFIRK